MVVGVFYTTSGQDTRMGSGSGLYIDRLKIENQVCYCDDVVVGVEAL